MWICPKCGREFKNENQSHYCGDKPTTIEAYIESQSEEIREILYLVKKTIHEAIPDAQEKISWGMPTYYKDGNIIHFAAHKKHLGLYAGVEAVNHFQEELKDYKNNKGTIQLPYNKEMPYALIERIAKWCFENR